MAKIGSCTVKIVNGNLTDSRAEAYVVPELPGAIEPNNVVNRYVLGAGASKGFADYQKHVTEHGPLFPGKALVTTSGGGQSRHLVHVTSIVPSRDDAFAAVRDGFYNALKAAEQKGIKEISAPALGSDNYSGFLSGEQSAKAMMAAVQRYSDQGGAPITVSFMTAPSEYTNGSPQVFNHVLQSQSYVNAKNERGILGDCTATALQQYYSSGVVRQQGQPIEIRPEAEQAAADAQKIGMINAAEARRYQLDETDRTPKGKHALGVKGRVALGIATLAAAVAPVLGIAVTNASHDATPPKDDTGTSSVVPGYAAANYADIISRDGKTVIAEAGDYTGPQHPKTEAGMQQAIRDVMAQRAAKQFDTLTLDFSSTADPADAANALAAVRDMQAGTFSGLQEVLVEGVGQPAQQVKADLDKAVAKNPGTQFDAIVITSNGACAIEDVASGHTPVQRTDAVKCR